MARQPEVATYRPRYRPLWNNLVTLGGIGLSMLAVLGLVTFGLFSIVTPAANPYVDVIGFLALPVVLAFGIALIPVGIFFKSWRLRRKDPGARLRFRFPRVDLNDPRQLRVAKIVVLSILILLPIVAVSSYHGYHFTDSTAFCANACHSVMRPQAMTFEHSPHARVRCAECHIGSGANWFVRSKLSGTRQVFAVLRDSYPRPIPPAITELRPARETCERCHWPKKFFGAQLKQIVHFASDERNTERRIEMLLKTGGGDETFGEPGGIHLHMALAGRIEYIATDDRLQEIPWVSWTDASGEELIYRSDGKPSSDPVPEGQRRAMDCMDCHNRPAHRFLSPERAIDIAMAVGRIDPSLPYIKRQAVAALVAPHDDAETAKEQIGETLGRYYRTEYPELFAERRDAIFRSIDALRDIYDHSVFPEMRIDWRTYPDNIGHLISPGCLRCHDGRHVNQYGQAISHACDACHTFLSPAEPEASMLRHGEFEHPYALGETHLPLRCDRCHTGGIGPEPSCEGCHELQQGLYDGTLEVLARFEPQPNPMFELAACEDCHDVSQSHVRERVEATCVDCHGDEVYGEMVGEWQAELAAAHAEADEVLTALEAELGNRRTTPAGETEPDPHAWLARGRAVLDTLQSAGAQHNPDAAFAAYAALTREGRELTDAGPGPGPAGEPSTE